MSVDCEFKRKVNLGYNYKGTTNPFWWIAFSLMILAVIYTLFVLYKIMTLAAFFLSLFLLLAAAKIIHIRVKDKK